MWVVGEAADGAQELWPLRFVPHTLWSACDSIRVQEEGRWVLGRKDEEGGFSDDTVNGTGFRREATFQLYLFHSLQQILNMACCLQMHTQATWSFWEVLLNS